MPMQTVRTHPIDGQKPGTSGCGSPWRAVFFLRRSSESMPSFSAISSIWDSTAKQACGPP